MTFACLSPLSRTCLKTTNISTNESFDKSWKTYLGQIDLEIGEVIVQRGRVFLESNVHETSLHKIAIIYLTKDGLSYTTQIAT